MIRQAVLQYIHEEQAVDRLSELLRGRKAVLIHGEQALKSSAQYLPELPKLLFTGHCTDQQVARAGRTMCHVRNDHRSWRRIRY